MTESFYRDLIAQLDRELRDLHKQLTAAQKAPEPLMMPLPSDEWLAKQSLFFCHMPPLLAALAQAGYEAQCALVPRLDTAGRPTHL